MNPTSHWKVNFYQPTDGVWFS